MQFNPEELELIPASRRSFWKKVAAESDVEIAERFRKKWTYKETLVVVTAGPDQTYFDVGLALGRSPGAIRVRRQGMISLLRDEHRAHDRVRAYLGDPRQHHKHADLAQVHEVLEGLGYYELPLTQQFELAVPLAQPRAGWRGDGSTAVLAWQRRQRQSVLALLRELEKESK